MDTLFGIPTNQLTLVLLVVFAVGALILAFLAARDRTSFRMAVSNIPRRKAQSALIVVGLMLATVLFSAAFTTGDTLTKSLRAQALENIGRVDVVVKASSRSRTVGSRSDPAPGSRKRPRHARDTSTRSWRMRSRTASRTRRASQALLRSRKRAVPVMSPKTDLSEPQVDVLGVESDSMKGFDPLRDRFRRDPLRGRSREERGLREPRDRRRAGRRCGRQRRGFPGPARRGVGKRDAPRTARDLPEVWRAGILPQGSRAERVLPVLRSALGPPKRRDEPSPPELKVAGVYESGANPASETSMVMPLEELQKLVGEGGRVNEVLVTHRGPAVEGGRYTDATVDEDRLPPLLPTDLEADPVKKDAIEQADQSGEIFSTLFVLFGQFSVAAGMLLIFLIFVMLAAERKHELGHSPRRRDAAYSARPRLRLRGRPLRARGERHGQRAGVGVGWVMVRLTGQGFAGGSEDFRIVFATSPQNVVLAFCMGMVLTFAVVLLSSWRVSRLNVVRAIRDIPEPDKRGRSVLGVIVAVLTPIAGAVAFWQGVATETVAFYLGGLSLMLIGLGAPGPGPRDTRPRRLQRVGARPARAVADPGLHNDAGGDGAGPEMFFVSGIALVVAGVWLVVFNADVILRVVVAVFGRIRGLPPVLKTAVKYPTQSLFRTGMTLAMFMLVVFTLTAMNFIQAAMSAAFGDVQELSGGYEIQGNAGYAAPIPDMNAALEDAEGIRKGSINGRGRGLQPPGGGQAERHRPGAEAALRAGRGRGLLGERRLRLSDDGQGLRLGARGVGGPAERGGHGRDLLRPRAGAKRLHLRRRGAARQAHRLLRRR